MPTNIRSLRLHIVNRTHLGPRSFQSMYHAHGQLEDHMLFPSLPFYTLSSSELHLPISTAGNPVVGNFDGFFYA